MMHFLMVLSMKKYIPIILCLFTILSVFSIPLLFSIQKNHTISKQKSSSPVTESSISSEPKIPEEFAVLSGKTIVIDPGHGGPDPGKVGINQSLEKEINLSISLKIKELLEQYGVTVTITRTKDQSLGEENASNQKRADMLKRIEIINQSNADIAISIHQNSFQQESSKGAQVFYHVSSEQGHILAEKLQEALITYADPENHRAAKSNDSYYLLKKSTCPLVIVECGFLSNSVEAERLCSNDYQDTLSQAIIYGIAAYFTN